jgi:hypothetical protein
MATSNPEPTVTEIEISIKHNTLIVGINGGNVTAGPGDSVVWRAGHGVPEFTLQFFRLAAEPAAHVQCDRIDVATLPRWPFAEPPPPNGIVGPTKLFRGTLTGKPTPATAFKYTVAVGNLQLDPIVILDR